MSFGFSLFVVELAIGSLDPIFVVQASFRRSYSVASTDYQRFLPSFKLMTSLMVQITRPLTGRICPVRAQRVKMHNGFPRLRILWAQGLQTLSDKRELS